MPGFHVQDFRSVEDSPASPAVLRARIGDIILHSTVARAKVEAIDAETGEYRVVLQGTLDRDEARRDES